MYRKFAIVLANFIIFFVREHRLERVGEAVKVIPISVDGADNLPEK